jgi:hypothetical protein
LGYPATAQNVIDREYDIKAAILYNLARKTTWPKDAQKPGEPFVIGILSPNPFGNRFDAFVKRGLHGRRVVVRTIENADDIPPCQVLFIPEARADVLQSVLERIGTKAVLIVGDGPGFAEKGVIVNMVERENSIKIEVNLKAAERAGLSISAEVLKLTTVVEGNGSEK